MEYCSVWKPHRFRETVCQRVLRLSAAARDRHSLDINSAELSSKLLAYPSSLEQAEVG